MKVKVEELGIETTLSDISGPKSYHSGDSDDMKEALMNEGSYDDEYISLEKIKDSDIVECRLNIPGSFEIIDVINSWKACEDDPFVMIVKDEMYGETDLCKVCEGDGEIDDKECKSCGGSGGYDEVAYITFEAIEGADPPSLKGGEYDEKFLMSSEEKDEFHELRENENITYDVKYQEFYFERQRNFKPDEWVKHWLASDFNYWNIKK